MSRQLVFTAVEFADDTDTIAEALEYAASVNRVVIGIGEQVFVVAKGTVERLTVARVPFFVLGNLRDDDGQPLWDFATVNFPEDGMAPEVGVRCVAQDPDRAKGGYAVDVPVN
jgi:hypothetical protein